MLRYLILPDLDVSLATIHVTKHFFTSGVIFEASADKENLLLPNISTCMFSTYPSKLSNVIGMLVQVT